MSQNISKGILSSIGKLWKDHELEDFKVEVDGEIIYCHSFILASFSDFFRNLLSSEMKEKQERMVQLKNISSKIFHLILNSLYTCCELLTEDNVIDVWYAVHQLQIHFLIEHCEDFVMAKLSLDTVEAYKRHAEYLQSERVSQHIFKFMLDNFVTFRKTESFLRLSYDDLIKLVESNKLVVSSEDLVLYSIYEWVSYGDMSKTNVNDIDNAIMKNKSNDSLQKETPDSNYSNNVEDLTKDNLNSTEMNTSITEKEELTVSVSDQSNSNERKLHLVQLLKDTRFCLASNACIIDLYRNKLTQENTLVKDILFQSSSFKCSDYMHELWPKAAIHRDCSNFEHAGFVCGSKHIDALSFKKNEWFCIKKYTNFNSPKLTLYSGKVYVCTTYLDSCSYSFISKVYVLLTDGWKQVAELPESILLFVSHENRIYLFNSNDKKITRFNPNDTQVKLELFHHDIENPEYAMSFDRNILVFCSVKNGENTGVHCWDTANNVWRRLDQLQHFSSKNMTSFHNDINTYILDSNGNLWYVTNSDDIEFIFIEKLWSFQCDIRGAAIFQKTLFICGNIPTGAVYKDKIDAVFSSIKFVNRDGQNSNFVHFVVPKDELQQSMN